MDTADVQEVVLVVVGQKSFHLSWVHAPVRLADIDHWKVEFRENVHFHPFGKSIGVSPFPLLKGCGSDGQKAGDQGAKDQDDNGSGAALS